MLGDDLNRDVIRQSLQELLGVRWKVQVVVEGAGASSGRSGPPGTGTGGRRAPPRWPRPSELMAERAADDVSDDGEPAPAVDPEKAALSLLRAQLGAHPVDS